MEDLVNIAMITDNNYVKPTIIAITSLKYNKLENTNYKIYILTTNLSNKNINLLKKCQANDIEIEILNKNNIVENFQGINQDRHVTPAALIKFFLPQIFPNLDKILYLDGDILIQKDLKKLYDTDIKQNYAAVVKDTLGVLDRKHMNKIDIKNEFYFNSGVMLLNLEKMRQDNITDKLIEFRISKKQHFMDQDAFNGVVGHNVEYMSYKYNFLNYYLTVMSVQNLSKLFNEILPLEEKSIYENCAIIHLGGKEKPWNYDLGYLTDLYEYYHKKSILKHRKIGKIYKIIFNRILNNIISFKEYEYKKIFIIFGIKIKFKDKQKEQLYILENKINNISTQINEIKKLINN